MTSWVMPSPFQFAEHNSLLRFALRCLCSW